MVKVRELLLQIQLIQNHLDLMLYFKLHLNKENKFMENYHLLI
jgi:hypothetical protein